METVDAIVAAAGGKPKKDDRVYYEAKRSKDGKSIEIEPQRLAEDETVNLMGRGKNIMTKNLKLSKNVVKHFGKKYHRHVELKSKDPHGTTDGYYYHLHYWRTKEEHLHCWVWEKTPIKP